MRYQAVANFLRQREQRLPGLPFTKTQGLVAAGGLLVHLLASGMGVWLLLFTIPAHAVAVVLTAPREGRTLFDVLFDGLRASVAPQNPLQASSPFMSLGNPPAQRVPLVWLRNTGAAIAGEASVSK